MPADSLAARLRFRWRTKLLLAFVLNAAVLGPYCWLGRHPVFPVFTMPATDVDRLVPPSDGWAGVYLSLNLLMPVGCLPIGDGRLLRRYVAGVLGIGFVACLVFLFFPTRCERPETSGSGLIATVRSLDTSLNACPSLHAAFAVFACLAAGAALSGLPGYAKVMAALWLWCALILFSTLATGQHVFADLVAGVALGFAGYVAAARCFSKTEP